VNSAAMKKRDRTTALPHVAVVCAAQRNDECYERGSAGDQERRAVGAHEIVAQDEGEAPQ
jgi:hypothetical protein